MGVLLVGCGYWGKNWAKTLHAMGELAAICEGNTDRHAELSAAYGVPVVAELTDALALSNIDAAIVATPANTHVLLAEPLLAAGIPTLVEKPLALTSQHAKRLANTAKVHNTLLSVGHICLFYPGMAKLNQWVTDGTLGKINRLICVRQKLGIIRNTENVWWSFAPHDVSMVLDVLETAKGCLPDLTVSQVTGHCDLGRPGLEDTVTAELATDDDTKVTIQVGWLSPHKQFELVAIGDKGVARLDHAGSPNGPAQTLTFTPFAKDGSGSVTPKHAETITRTWDTIDPPLMTQATAFLQAVRHGVAIPNTAANGVAVVDILANVQAALSQQAMGDMPQDQSANMSKSTVGVSSPMPTVTPQLAEV